MPIALLPELVATLTKVGGKLGPWERLVALEEEILRRARGAFLVHWFGRRVPERRLSLHIAIVNIAALKARYRLAEQSMPGPFAHLNLFGPIAGMAGVAAGLFASPSGVILFAPFLHDVFDMLEDSWWKDPLTFFYALIGNWIMPLAAPGLALGLAAPFGMVMALGLAVSNERTSHAFIRLLGNAALLADAFLIFWEQLSGPVAEIRNPLVRAIVTLLGRISALFAQTLGFAAILIVRLAPLVPHLVAQFRAAMALGEAVLAALRDILSGLLDTLMAPFRAGRGILDTLTGIYDAILDLPGRLLEKVNDLISDMMAVLGDAFGAIVDLIGSYVAGVAERIVSAFHMTPLGWLIDRIMALVALVPRFIEALRNAPKIEVPPPPPEQDQGMLSRAWDWVGDTAGDAWDWTKDTAADAYTLGLTGQVEELQDAARRLRLPQLPETGPLPEFPDLPTLPDAASIVAPLPDAPDFAAEATRMLQEAERATGRAAQPAELLRRPRSAFAAERAALAKEGPPQLSEMERGLRDMIYLAVGRVLPAALRIHAPEVRRFFDKIDATLYPDAPADPVPDPAHPQQILPDSGRLAPHVSRLVIRARDVPAPDLRVFRDRLVGALGAQPYFAADAG